MLSKLCLFKRLLAAPPTMFVYARQAGATRAASTRCAFANASGVRVRAAVAGLSPSRLADSARVSCRHLAAGKRHYLHKRAYDANDRTSTSVPASPALSDQPRLRIAGRMYTVTRVAAMENDSDAGQMAGMRESRT